MFFHIEKNTREFYHRKKRKNFHLICSIKIDDCVSVIYHSGKKKMIVKQSFRFKWSSVSYFESTDKAQQLNDIGFEFRAHISIICRMECRIRALSCAHWFRKFIIKIRSKRVYNETVGTVKRKERYCAHFVFTHSIRFARFGLLRCTHSMNNFANVESIAARTECNKQWHSHGRIYSLKVTKAHQAHANNE